MSGDDEWLSVEAWESQEFERRRSGVRGDEIAVVREVGLLKLVL